MRPCRAERCSEKRQCFPEVGGTFPAHYCKCCLFLVFRAAGFVWDNSGADAARRRKKQHPEVGFPTCGSAGPGSERLASRAAIKSPVAAIPGGGGASRPGSLSFVVAAVWIYRRLFLLCAPAPISSAVWSAPGRFPQQLLLLLRLLLVASPPTLRFALTLFSVSLSRLQWRPETLLLL